MANSKYTFMGYIRKDGKVGVRNYVAILPLWWRKRSVEATSEGTIGTQVSCIIRVLPDTSDLSGQRTVY
jgi:altronate dehydratase